MAITILEPEAGSDFKSMDTRVTERSNELVIDGEKTWVGNVADPSAAVVWAMFPEGLGTVIVDLDAAGVQGEYDSTNMSGYHQSHFTLNYVHVPRENVLVRGKSAFKEQLQALN